MKCYSRARKVAAAAAMSVLFLAGGCGYKNLPVPPDSVVPKPVDDLRFISEGKGGKLSWTFPVETVQGADLLEIDGFELYQASMAQKDYCPTCPVPFTGPVAVPGGASSVEGKKKTATYEVPQLVAGHKYFFKVRSRTSWWAASDDSNVVSFVWHMAAAAPQGLQSKAGQRQIELSWQPVKQLQDGSPLTMPVQYQLQRSLDGKSFTTLTELTATSYRDSDVRIGQKYSYRVQSQVRVGQENAAGGTSAVITAGLAELSVLVPPTGVGVAETVAGTKIFWDKAKESGLAGYRIYRRAADRDRFELIGEVTADFNLYVDTTAKEGVSYYYVVTTLGSGSPAEESAQSRPASARR